MKSTHPSWSLLLLLAAFALAGTPSVANEDNPQSANAIMPGCRAFLSGSGKDGWLMGLCAGIVEGLLFETSIWQATTEPEFVACLKR